MSISEIAVLGATLSVSPATGSTGTGGVAVVTALPQTKVRIGHKGVYADTLSFTVAGVLNTVAGATTPSPVETFSLVPTASKTKVSGLRPIRKGDKVTVTTNPIIPGTPPAPCPTVMVVELENAGQTKVRGL